MSASPSPHGVLPAEATHTVFPTFVYFEAARAAVYTVRKVGYIVVRHVDIVGVHRRAPAIGKRGEGPCCGVKHRRGQAVVAGGVANLRPTLRREHRRHVQERQQRRRQHPDDCESASHCLPPCGSGVLVQIRTPAPCAALSRPPAFRAAAPVRSLSPPTHTGRRHRRFAQCIPLDFRHTAFYPIPSHSVNKSQRTLHTNHSNSTNSTVRRYGKTSPPSYRMFLPAQ